MKVQVQNQDRGLIFAELAMGKAKLSHQVEPHLVLFNRQSPALTVMEWERDVPLALNVKEKAG